MKIAKIEQSKFVENLARLYYEIERVNNNISVLTMLHDNIDESTLDSSMLIEIGVLNAVRCGLVDTLAELEKVHEYMLSHIEGNNDATKH